MAVMQAYMMEDLEIPYVLIVPTREKILQVEDEDLRQKLLERLDYTDKILSGYDTNNRDYYEKRKQIFFFTEPHLHHEKNFYQICVPKAVYICY